MSGFEEEEGAFSLGFAIAFSFFFVFLLGLSDWVFV